MAMLNNQRVCFLWTDLVWSTKHIKSHVRSPSSTPLDPSCIIPKTKHQKHPLMCSSSDSKTEISNASSDSFHRSHRLGGRRGDQRLRAFRTLRRLEGGQGLHPWWSNKFFSVNFGNKGQLRYVCYILYVWNQSFWYMCICTYICTRGEIYIYIYIYTYMHIHIYNYEYIYI